MQIETTRFGTIEVSDSSVLNMTEGLLGFEHCTKYVLLEDQPEAAFKWLQAVDDPSIAFVLINPSDFFKDYEVELNDEEADSLGLTDPSEAVMFTTVTLTNCDSTISTNLAGPIIVNLSTLKARQVVLQDDRYSTKHVIADKAATTTSECTMAKAA